jgi:NAD+ synthase
MSILNFETLVGTITAAMRRQAEEAGTDKAQVDVSGGVDSAVVAALSCIAFDPDKVIGTYTSIHSSEESSVLARAVAKRFGFRLVELDLSEQFDQIVRDVRSAFEKLGLDFPSPGDPASRTVFGSLRSCLRAPVGRFVNRAFGGGIRQGTGNRDEDELLRFYQKGGDGEVDANWIAGLFKSEVWELAAHLGVPQEVIDAEPTPDLWGVGSEHNDEDELASLAGVPLTYTRPGEPMGTIEWASRENERNGIITGAKAALDPGLAGYSKGGARIIEAVRKMERITRHKAEPPPHLRRRILKNIGAVD